MCKTKQMVRKIALKCLIPALSWWSVSVMDDVNHQILSDLISPARFSIDPLNVSWSNLSPSDQSERFFYQTEWVTTVWHNGLSKNEKKEGKDGCWDGRLGRKCWRWAEVKEPGAEMKRNGMQEKEKKKRCSRNERALLLLIIGGVMCQHSLRGFPPEGMIPWGLGHWNHITAPPHAPAHFLCLLMVRQEGSRAPFCSFLSIFMGAHSCRVGCRTPLKGFLSKEYSIWDLICGHWQKKL